VNYDPTERIVTVMLSGPLRGVTGKVRISDAEKKSTRQWPWPKTPSTGPTEGWIVIDASELDFQPVAYPELQTVDGLSVFDFRQVARPVLRQRLAVVYAIQKIRPLYPKTASQPSTERLLLRASQARKPRMLLLNEKQLAKLSAFGKANEAMKQGRVIVLVKALD